MTLNIKLYHWQTTSFSRHKATDDLFGELLELIDTFVEVYMGKYNRPQFNEKTSITIQEMSDEQAVKMIENYIKFLKVDLQKYIKTTDTDLFNIRDEMLQHFNKTLYLFTLN
jgi:DNA-binding ferritin-like protein